MNSSAVTAIHMEINLDGVLDGGEVLQVGNSMGLHLPRYRIIIVPIRTMMVDPHYCKGGECSEGSVNNVGSVDNASVVSDVGTADAVFAAMHDAISSRIPSRPPCFITKIPHELLLMIIKYARCCKEKDLRTLKGLTYSCTTLMHAMRAYRTEIIEYYTYNSFAASHGEITYTTMFCGMKHSINDEPSSSSVGGTTKAWHRFGKLHRTTGPAYISKTYEAWYRYGEKHRDDGGPAIIEDGRQHWIQNDVYFRDNDLPTFITRGGTMKYGYGRYNTLHRDGDKPAVIRVYGTQEWYKHGKRHRGEGKPAIVYTDGQPPRYWVEGVKVG